MPTMLTVNLARPFQSVRVLNDGGGQMSCSSSDAAASSAAASKELAAQVELYQNLCRTLEGAVGKLNQFCESLFSGHNEAIARLSTEIARKVLVRNIADGDYEIEAIVKETLKNAPGIDDVVIRLNPQDLTDCRTLQQDGDSELAGVELLADPNIGRAECVLESPKGIIHSLIDEHLERIGKALEKTQ